MFAHIGTRGLRWNAWQVHSGRAGKTDAGAAAAASGCRAHGESLILSLQTNKKHKRKKQGLTSSLSQEYCNQVMPGFDQNERYLLEQRER